MTQSTTEQVLADAEASAAFYRTLITGGVPVNVAAQITASYASAMHLARASKDPGHPPWDPPS